MMVFPLRLGQVANDKYNRLGKIIFQYSYCCDQIGRQGVFRAKQLSAMRNPLASGTNRYSVLVGWVILQVEWRGRKGIVLRKQLRQNCPHREL